MTRVTLPPRTRRTHLGCRVLETQHIDAARTRATRQVVIRHDITLFCPKPYIPSDIRPRSA